MTFGTTLVCGMFQLKSGLKFQCLWAYYLPFY
jgi:hypothetical protein